MANEKAIVPAGAGYWDTTYYPYGGSFHRFAADTEVTLTGRTYRRDHEFTFLDPKDKKNQIHTGWTSEFAALGNPFVRVRFPARTDKLFRYKKTGRFGKLRRKNPLTFDEYKKLEKDRLYWIKQAMRQARKRGKEKRDLGLFNLGQAEGIANAIRSVGYQYAPSTFRWGIGYPGYRPETITRKFKTIPRVLKRLGYPKSNPGGIDYPVARELYLFIESDGNLYRQMVVPIMRNLARKVGRGVYDKAKAVKLWQYLADEGARRYTREHGTGSGVGIFNKPTRVFVAAQFARKFMDLFRRGEYTPEIMGLAKGKKINPIQTGFGPCGVCGHSEAMHLVFKPTKGGYRKAVWSPCNVPGCSCPGHIRREVMAKNPVKGFRYGMPTLASYFGQVGVGKSRARFSHKRLLPPSMFKKGSFRTIKLPGGKRLIVGRPKGERKTAAQAILTPKANPARKQIGRAVTLIETTGGKLIPRGVCPLLGLPGGSVMIRGFFGKLPAGNVTRIEYLDESKAKREGFKNPSTPWRHDFTAERRPLKKTRGGLLIPAGKKPLWGMR